MRSFFFFKMSKIESKFRKEKKKIEKKFFFCETIASEKVAINMLSKEENTCYQLSMG